jgi:hypothetical protein
VGKARNEDRERRKAAERAAADQREQRQRRTSLIWRGAGVIAVVIAVAVSYSFYNKSRLLKAVTTTSYAAGMHVAGPIVYRENPPMGGQHNIVWQNCGVYNAPIHNEHAVHSMEHGAVWITYRPDLPSDQVQSLKALAADDFMLLSPYPGLPHAVVASAWNHQLTFERVDDAGLRAFISEYKNNPATTPEFGAACLGGTSALATTDSLNSSNAAMAR